MLDKNRCSIPERFRDKPLFNELHRGMNFGFMARRGYYNRPEVRKQPQLGNSECELMSGYIFFPSRLPGPDFFFRGSGIRRYGEKSA